MPEAVISITCSKGTYIRALARDIGIILGSGAYLTALRRTRSGDFYVENAMTFEKFREKINPLAAETTEIVLSGFQNRD